MAEASKRTGRPSGYNPDFCAVVLALGENGKTKAQMARALKISRETFDRWREQHSEFDEAVKEATDLSLAWWEEKNQEGVDMGKDLNATAMIFAMKNRFPKDYRDRQEVTGADGSALFSPDLLAAAAALRKQEGEK